MIDKLAEEHPLIVLTVVATIILPEGFFLRPIMRIFGWGTKGPVKGVVVWPLQGGLYAEPQCLLLLRRVRFRSCLDAALLLPCFNSEGKLVLADAKSRHGLGKAVDLVPGCHSLTQSIILGPPNMYLLSCPSRMHQLIFPSSSVITFPNIGGIFLHRR